MLSNPFSKLAALFPSDPLLVGTVTAYADGVATIEMPGGGVMQARGVAAVDDRVFFRSGAIEGPAPGLPIEIIEV